MLSLGVRCTITSMSFCHSFTTENSLHNFLFASLDKNKTFKITASYFILELTPIFRGGEKTMADLLPLKVHLFILTLLNLEWPKLRIVLAILRAIGLSPMFM